MGMTADEAPVTAARAGKSQSAFRTISEVADELDVAQHVLRFWESKFPQVRPLKRGGGRRYYRPEDIDLLRDIRTLLYDEGYTIKGAQKLLRQRRARATGQTAASSTTVAIKPQPAAAERTPERVAGGELASVPTEIGPLQHQLEATVPAPKADPQGSVVGATTSSDTGARDRHRTGPRTVADGETERLRQVRDTLRSIRGDLAALVAAVES